MSCICFVLVVSGMPRRLAVLFLSEAPLMANKVYFSKCYVVLPISVQMRYCLMHKVLLSRCDLLRMQQDPMVGLCVFSQSIIVKICQAIEHNDGEYIWINVLLQYMARSLWVLCSSQIEWILLLVLLLSRLVPVLWSEFNAVIAEPVGLSLVLLFHGEQDELLLIAASVQGCDGLFGLLELSQRDRLRIGCRYDHCCFEVQGHSGEVMI